MALSTENYSQPALNIANCVTVKLSERTYLLWKTQFESFLCGQGLLGFINGSTPRPVAATNADNTPNQTYQAWIHSDQVVKAWLLGSLSEDILSEVISTSTSQEVWNYLAAHFNKVSSARLFGLQRKLQNTEKKDMPMVDYLKELKSVCDQLASVGSPVSERMKIFAALNGLSREYEPIKTSIEGMLDGTPSPTLDDVIPRLTAFNDRLLSYTEETSISPHLAFNTQQFVSSHYSNRGRGNRSRVRGGYSTRSRGFHQQISASSRSSGQSADNRPICQICGKAGHVASTCWHRFDNTYQPDLPAALAALRITDVTDQAGH
ncbi:PREDICTED: uncharacterized protein LOC109130462 [Camelina sativa]|uniref:Uncharacterized protein LOC109130462 n=1 Tax=Camelina sativa TaxID=90675 RepID=A0ABM1R988_CAMSA|nr:PREDICTED: uncharacterized protein LOC109130462 [Camelina sativa]